MNSHESQTVSGNRCVELKGRGRILPRRISRFALEQRSRLDDTLLDDGIKRLMWAILKDTLRSYQTYVDARNVYEQRHFREADRWVRSRDVSWVFSFESICAVLGIDSDYLRTEIMRWGRQRFARVRSEEVERALA